MRALRPWFGNDLAEKYPFKGSSRSGMKLKKK